IHGGIGAAIEPGDPLASGQAPFQVLDWHFGVDGRELEGSESVLGGDVLDERDEMVDSVICAGVGGAPDDHRNPQPTGLQQHGFQILPLPGDRTHLGVGAESTGADIATSGVSDQHIGVLFATGEKALLFEGCERQVAGWTENPHLSLPTTVVRASAGRGLRVQRFHDTPSSSTISAEITSGLANARPGSLTRLFCSTYPRYKCFSNLPAVSNAIDGRDRRRVIELQH